MNSNNKYRKRIILILGIIFTLSIFPNSFLNISSHKISVNEIKDEIKSSGITWTVDDDLLDFSNADFTVIEDAINATNDGDTILVYPGVYTENINVNKRINVKSIGGVDVTFVNATSSNGYGFKVEKNFVNISGFTVTNASYAGIQLIQVEYCNISNNNLFDNQFGIMASGKISGTHHGHNLISNNNCSNSNADIYFFYSANNVVTGNIMENKGILVSGNSIFSHTQEIDTSNLVNGKPVYYINGITGEQVPTNVGQVILVNCSDINIANLNINGTYNSIRVVYSSYVNIENNNISYSQTYDIFLTNSKFCNVTYNNFSNSYSGIALTNNAHDNKIMLNYISNTYHGIHIASSDTRNNELVQNTIIDNWAGIYIQGRAPNNTIKENNFINNYRPMISNSDGYRYLNNFINSTYYSSSSDPTWNSPETLVYTYEGNDFTNYLGNYWEEYSGTDDNNDGIGDTPFHIVLNNYDYYPLMMPFENYLDIQDTISPNTEIISGPSEIINYNDVTFTWTGSDDTTPTQDLVCSYYLEGYDSGWSIWTLNTSKTYNHLPNGDYIFRVRAKDSSGNIDPTSAERSFTISMEPEPEPDADIKLQKEGIEISEIDVGDFFDIYVGDSTDDIGIEQVRFSSDDEQDGMATGEWTEWYEWDITSGDWNHETKIKCWAFATGGNKEVWAEVKDTESQIDSAYDWITAILINQPPNIPGSIKQFQSDGITAIPEGGETYDTTLVFKGFVSDPDGDDVRLEIELREIDQVFTGEPFLFIDLVPSGTEVTITQYGLEPGEYHWQYRARDSKDASSEWEEYGSDGNIDFTVNLSIDKPPSLESFLSKTKIFSAFGHSITLNLSLFSNTTHNNEVLSDWNVESDEGYDLKFGIMLEVYNLRNELESLSVPQFILDFYDLIISDDDAIRFLITANVISGYDKNLDEFILDVKDIVEPLLPIIFNPKNKISVPVSARWFFDNPIVEQWFHITKGTNQYDLKLKGSEVDNPIMAVLNVLDIFFRIDFQLLTYQGGEVIPAKIGSHDLISARSFAIDIIKLNTKAVRIAGTAGADLLAWGPALGTSYCLFHEFIFDPPMILKTILDSVFPGLHDTIYDIFDEMEDISNWIYVGASFLDPPAARLDLALFDNESNLLLGYDPNSNSTIQSSEQGFVVGDQNAQFMLIYNNSNEVYDLKVINSDLDGVDNSHLNYSIILKQIGSNKTFHSEGYLREGESTSTLLQMPTATQPFSVNTLEITLLSSKYPIIQIWISDQNNNSVDIDSIEMYLNGEEISFEFTYEGNGIYMLSDFVSSYNENETFQIIVKKDKYFMNLLSINFSPITGEAIEDAEKFPLTITIIVIISIVGGIGIVTVTTALLRKRKRTST